MFGIRLMAGSLVLVVALAACSGAPAGTPAQASTPPAASRTSSAAPTNGAAAVPDQLNFSAKTVDGKPVVTSQLSEQDLKQRLSKLA